MIWEIFFKIVVVLLSKFVIVKIYCRNKFLLECSRSILYDKWVFVNI